MDTPFNPPSVALGAEGTFVARAIDRDAKHLTEVLKRADAHKGTAFIEILQNCNIFNDGAWASLTDRAVKDDNVLYLEHGKPLIFGRERNKGIVRDEMGRPKVVVIGEDGIEASDILVHDEQSEDPTYAFMLTRLLPPEFPTPVGIFRAVSRPTYETLVQEQIAEAKEKKQADLHALLSQGDTWEVR